MFYLQREATEGFNGGKEWSLICTIRIFLGGYVENELKGQGGRGGGKQEGKQEDCWRGDDEVGQGCDAGDMRCLQCRRSTMLQHLEKTSVFCEGGRTK